MTIYEVLKQNIEILENLRIPAKERELWGAMQQVLQNEQMCVAAMEEAERKQAEKKATEESAKESAEEPENVIPMEEKSNE